MSAHNHPERVPGCFRCDLSAIEVATTSVELHDLEDVAREFGIDLDEQEPPC